MIEKLHRYRIVLIFGLILVVAAFVFGDFYTGRNDTRGGSPALLGMSGKSYDKRDLQKLGSGPLNLIQDLFRMGDPSLYYALSPLFVMGESNDPAITFFIGRVILRTAREEYGLYPSRDEISARIRKMPAFSNTPPGSPGMPAQGAFDQAKYDAFIKNDVGRGGLTENDFFELVADEISLAKLKDILSSGITDDKAAVILQNALAKQTIVADIARLDLSTFQDKIQPTEDEIKQYWEPIKDAFKTVLRRKFTYVLATPVFPPDPSATPDPKESITDAAATDDTKKAAEKKREEEKALKKAKYDDQCRNIQRAIDSQVSEFSEKLDDLVGKPGTSLDSIVAEFIARNAEAEKTNATLPADQPHIPICKWEIKATDLFTANQPPAEVNLPIRNSGQNAGMAPSAFYNIHPTNVEAISYYAQPIPVGQGQWLIARLDGEEPVRDMTFPEARADARARLIEEKAKGELKAAIETALAKMKELTAAGKSFAEAAKEAGVLDPTTVADLTATRRPAPGATEPQALFNDASKVAPGSFADPVIDSEHAFILRVDKREVVKDPNAATTLSQNMTRADEVFHTMIFKDWIDTKVEQAKVDKLYEKIR